MSPVEVCERILIDAKSRYEQAKIAPSERAIIDRLLSRTADLRRAYEEIHKKLGSRPPALQVFLEQVAVAAAYWNEEKMAQARIGRSELRDANRQITKLALELAECLDRRSKLHDVSGFSGNTHVHIGEVIINASKGNGHFKLYLEPRLESLMAQFDLKYWPSLADITRELGRDAEKPRISAHDASTAAATEGRRPSKADFLNA